MSKFIRHPLSEAFPSLSQDELATLAADIKQNGLRHPIITWNGSILDGWNRYQACIRAHVKPIFEEYAGTDPAAFVKSLNWARRHMTPSQRAQAVVAINEWAGAGRPKTGSCEPISTGKTIPEMAAEASVSPAHIKAAKVVEKEGSADLKQAVIDGKIPVRRAADIARGKEASKPAPEADWKAKYEALAASHQELDERHRLMADELATCEAIRRGEHALEMNTLRATLHSVERRRDELMVEVAEMRKQVAHWKRLADKEAA